MNEKFRSVISHSSDDKVKVVYAWHGPRGPIWNTELPNVLSFASVSEGVGPYMESRHFWCDDLWQKLFSFQDEMYELTTAQSIEFDDMRPFVYPFSLAWRVPFESYFCGNSGILEFSHMPDWLVHLCIIGNGYILIDHSVEAFMSDRELDSMYSYFHHNHNIPMYKIMYLTGTINGEQVYDDWANRNNIPDDKDHRMKIIPYASSREIFSRFLECGDTDGNLAVEPHYDPNHVPEKLFLSWNRRFRTHRTLLALILEKYNLIERSVISFAKHDEERFTDTFIKLIHNMDKPIRPYGNGSIEFNSKEIERFNSRLPLVIDGEKDVNKMCEDFGFTADYYKQTLVSLVTETNFTLNECTLTEKSFKPLLHKHPFIILGVPGAVRGLRNLGFQTFGEFWDESYDETDDPGNRMVKIAEILKDIGTWDDNRIRDFRMRVKPILDHNYNLLKERGSVLIGNKIYNHITDNFEREEHHATCHQVRCFDR
jgi:hypothetical protein